MSYYAFHHRSGCISVRFAGPCECSRTARKALALPLEGKLTDADDERVARYFARTWPSGRFERDVNAAPSIAVSPPRKPAPNGSAAARRAKADDKEPKPSKPIPEADAEMVECADCEGEGEIDGKTCATCQGRGEILKVDSDEKKEKPPVKEKTASAMLAEIDRNIQRLNRAVPELMARAPRTNSPLAKFPRAHVEQLITFRVNALVQANYGRSGFTRADAEKLVRESPEFREYLANQESEPSDLQSDDPQPKTLRFGPGAGEYEGQEIPAFGVDPWQHMRQIVPDQRAAARLIMLQTIARRLFSVARSEAEKFINTMEPATARAAMGLAPLPKRILDSKWKPSDEARSQYAVCLRNLGEEADGTFRDLYRDALPIVAPRHKHGS